MNNVRELSESLVTDYNEISMTLKMQLWLPNLIPSEKGEADNPENVLS